MLYCFPQPPPPPPPAPTQDQATTVPDKHVPQLIFVAFPVDFVRKHTVHRHVCGMLWGTFAGTFAPKRASEWLPAVQRHFRDTFAVMICCMNSSSKSTFYCVRFCGKHAVHRHVCNILETRLGLTGEGWGYTSQLGVGWGIGRIVCWRWSTEIAEDDIVVVVVLDFVLFRFFHVRRRPSSAFSLFVCGLVNDSWGFRSRHRRPCFCRPSMFFLFPVAPCMANMGNILLLLY